VLAQFFTLEGGRYYHSRVERELARFDKLSAKAKKAGQMSAQARWGKREVPPGVNFGITTVTSELELNGNKSENHPRTNNQEPITKGINTPHTPQGGQVAEVVQTAIKAAVEAVKAPRRKRVAAPVIYTPEFEKFWQAYPRKTGKGDAAKSWNKLGPPPSAEQWKAALAWQSESLQWTKDGGQFIPMPATYLNQRRWEDEPTQTANNNVGLFGWND
jgi:hypothetical protein